MSTACLISDSSSDLFLSILFYLGFITWRTVFSCECSALPLMLKYTDSADEEENRRGRKSEIKARTWLSLFQRARGEKDNHKHPKGGLGEEDELICDCCEVYRLFSHGP